MVRKPDKLKNPAPAEKPVSLKPLKLEEALEGLLKVDPGRLKRAAKDGQVKGD